MKDGEGKVGMVEAGQGWDTRRQWGGHTKEEQDTAVKRGRNSQHLSGRAGTSRGVKSAQA